MERMDLGAISVTVRQGVVSQGEFRIEKLMTQEGIDYTGQSGTISSVEFAVLWDVDQARLADLGLGNS